MPKKTLKVEASDSLVGSTLEGSVVIKAEDSSVNGKDVKVLTLADGTTKKLSVEVLAELTK